ncbi:type I-B CRISPR-associated protein Cas7/Cst2/DevR [Aliibacillus thermotolerans]|uniref:Type I-B CRISPR-associated protein Cas7/Cst2/DevR n=1 Tax=Aliibacillus thermotolerans TaxID=1834418 RepID=A0ABW0U7Y5_9BACI|nr:type I-B CRISPR-associated protein Cas7/Cst2/DevR [Aliibacillus thermotolerans]MDA3129373.1 type I-B CRISPR-associated protein Cas7/Cst2/DevR [Aliibacillus thermotolerans]
MKKAMTLTVIFQANSLNYGEGISNISELKKIHRGNGDVLTFASRQSLRYDIVRLGNEMFDWNLKTVDKSKRTVQFKEDVTIEDSVEMDLFGYLKTSKKSQKRPAVARLSHAISLEPYNSDMEFLNNMGLAERINEDPNLANIEQHESLYTYTLTLDLTRVGIDGEIELSTEEKTTRIHQLLDILKVLNRNIRGRQESLAPLFVVGGVYDVANPFFLGKVRLNIEEKGWNIDFRTIKSVCEQTFAGKKVGDQTKVALLDGVFTNEQHMKETFGDQLVTMEQFFESLNQEAIEALGELA